MIFVPKKNIYFPQPKWGFPKFQRGAVSVTVFSNAAQQGTSESAKLDTTITVGNEVYELLGTADSAIIYGYNRVANADIVAEPTFGSAGAFNYSDGGSNSRDVTAMYYGAGTAAGGSLDDDLIFSITGTTAPDTDATFTKIDYDGTERTRSSATYTTGNGSSHWRWNNVTPNGPLSGSGITFKVYT